MHKNELIRQVAVKCGVSRPVAGRIINEALETIVEEVSQGQKVVLTGFGTFQLRHRSARRGVDPRTAAEISVPSSRTPGFTASATFKGYAERAGSSAPAERIKPD